MKTSHHGQMSESFLTAVFLSLSGGLQDAYTYLFRGKVFANAQTGNIVLLSANLGVMNLLPLPALDGGRLVFLVTEAIRRKPVNRQVEGMIHFAGLMLLMALMVIVMYNDILKIF